MLFAPLLPEIDDVTFTLLVITAFGSAAIGLDVAGDTGYFYLLLAFTVIATLGVIALTRSRLGRLLRGTSESS